MDTRRSRAASTDWSWKPRVECAKRLFASENLIPLYCPLAAVCFRHSCIKDALGGLPNVATRTVTFDKWNDGIIWYEVLTVGILDGLAALRQGHFVVALLHGLVTLRGKMGAIRP